MVVGCPSVLWLRKAPTDNKLLTGWWLRKATRGGVVMATEACQIDCVEIGQVWTHNQYPPPPTRIWHFRQRTFCSKIMLMADSEVTSTHRTTSAPLCNSISPNIPNPLSHVSQRFLLCVNAWKPKLKINSCVYTEMLEIYYWFHPLVETLHYHDIKIYMVNF